jgi:large-conductance mechanosensitive channel
METIKNNISDYINFLKQNNIIGFAIGLMLASSVIEISNVTIDSIVMPTLDPILKKNKNYTIKIGSLQIDLEKFVRSLLKLLILSFIIFLLFKYGMKLNITTTLRPN